MKMNVKERARAVATYRGILVTLMETVARWVPTTAEMEVKLLFGTHIWDLAQHADAFGKRTHELRLPLQHSMPPTDAYAGMLKDLEATAGTTERLDALYRVMLPGLAARLRGYLDRTDDLMDAPTVRIIDRILFDHQRMHKEYEALLAKLPDLGKGDGKWAEQLSARESVLEAIAAEAS